MITMAITTIKHYPFGAKLIYLTGGAYELLLRDGRVLVHKCSRKSKSNDTLAIEKANQYLNREV